MKEDSENWLPCSSVLSSVWPRWKPKELICKACVEDDLGYHHNFFCSINLKKKCISAFRILEISQGSLALVIQRRELI